MPTRGTFFADLAKVYRAEIAELAAAGCRYIQLDEVAVAMLCDPAIRDRIASAGQKPDALVDLYIGAINDCVAGAPADMAIGVHMCRGNFRGRYLSEGGYESVAERFFANSKVTHFLLEYDTARAGDFKPLRFVPKAKGVVLGLVSTKTPVLEIDRRPEAPHGRGRQAHRRRQARHRPAVRLCLDRRRQPAHRGRRARQAAARRRGGPGDLGVMRDATRPRSDRPPFTVIALIPAVSACVMMLPPLP